VEWVERQDVARGAWAMDGPFAPGPRNIAGVKEP
jgi:hypothetical protein